MIAIWMLYCTLCAVGFSAAAALAERSLLAGRDGVRFVWIAAIALSIVIPVAALRVADRNVQTDAFPAEVPVDISANERVAAPSEIVASPVQRSTRSGAAAVRVSWAARLARFDRPLAIAWAALSLALALDLLGGIAVLARMRRRWERRELQGTPVYISAQTGPAVVGALSPAIVLPEWVLALEPAQLALMLRHEREHQRAGDGRLLSVAGLALLVMPWNVALWWQLLRLRVAVELDCDARVLQNADARAYGDLLLEVARPRRGPRLSGATSFAERATGLERRIRVLPRHRARTSRLARAIALTIGIAAVSVAWASPRPPAPAVQHAIRGALPVPQPAPPAATTAAPEMSSVSAASTSAPTVGHAGSRGQSQLSRTDRSLARVASITAMPVTRRRAVVREADVSRSPRASCARDGATDESTLVDSIFARLFDGMALTEAETRRACDLLTTLRQEQAEIDRGLRSLPQRYALVRARRDTALRALLDNDEDRARFDAHAAAMGAGGRGGGGPVPAVMASAGGRGNPVFDNSFTYNVRVDGAVSARADTAAGGFRAGGGARSGGAGGGFAPTTQLARSSVGGGERGRGTFTVDTATLNRFNEQQIDMQLARLFEGITLTPEQNAAARLLFVRAQLETALLRAPAPRLRMTPSGIVSMQAEHADALGALLGNDADRATLRSRMTILRQ